MAAPLSQSVGVMSELRPNLWLELGPGRVLSGLLRRIDRTQTAHAAADMQEIRDFAEALENG